MRKYVCVVVRILVALFISRELSLITAVLLIGHSSNFNERIDYLYATALPMLGFYLLIGGFLWFHYDIFLDKEGEEESVKLDILQFSQVAIIAVSFYFMFDSATGLLTAFLEHDRSVMRASGQGEILPMRDIITLMVSMICIFKSKWLIGFLTKS